MTLRNRADRSRFSGSACTRYFSASRGGQFHGNDRHQRAACRNRIKTALTGKVIVLPHFNPPLLYTRLINNTGAIYSSGVRSEKISQGSSLSKRLSKKKKEKNRERCCFQ
ncbi:hypothetical protein PUN28_014793 [Cardiocondyla obscurior]|uniref:Uncharacterized protein n=1 Tax=Cardiocondyla obscurior TaxID=286306 RepID=A0AAW2EZX2_9HYME